jgi:hypothetical protein
MTFGHWHFAAATQRANGLGYAALFVVSTAGAGYVVNSVPAADSGQLVASNPGGIR